MKNLVIGLILIAALGLVLYLAPQKTNAPTNNNNTPVVTDYASCVSAGYPIAQTSPVTCSTPDGRIFTDNTSASEPEAVIDIPQTAQIVTSPLAIKGKALNSWFFEANLPIILKDE